MRTVMNDKYKEKVNKELDDVVDPEESTVAKKAAEVIGEEEVMKIQEKVKDEVYASSILAKKRLLYGSSIEEHNKKVDKIGSEGLRVSQEYKKKKDAIQQDENLTNKGKATKLESLYKEYNEKAKGIISKQGEELYEHQVEYSKIAKSTLKEVEETSSIRDFSETDMQYILYMLKHANNEMLLGVLEEYDFNPFLIKMVNARDSKEPTYITRPGADPLSPNSTARNEEKLQIEHPLKALIKEPSRQNGKLYTKEGSKSLSELIPIEGVPSVDLWAQTEDVNPLWRR